MPNQRGFWNWFLRRAPALAKNEGGGMSSSTPRNGTPILRNGCATSPAHVVPLATVVERFNSVARLDRIGQDQSPLTIDEVLTAIRSAGRHQLPLSESQRRQIHAIADTQRIPADAEIKFTTSYVSLTGYRCEVWWIDLVMSFPGEGSDPRQTCASSLRIRDHRLRSWYDPSITIPSEIQRLQADHRWYPGEIAEPAHQ